MPFKLEEFHRNTSDEELIEDLVRVARSLDSNRVTIDAYNENGRFHATTLTRRFGSWFEALNRAGLEKTRNLNIPTEDLFANLAEIWLSLGKQPKYADLSSSSSRFSSGTYEKRFGGWRKALQAFVEWANEGTLPSTDESGSNQKSSKRTPRKANWRQRAQVLMRDGATCRLCGGRPEDGLRLHVDHVVAWSKGGETELGNLQILCEPCNIGKSNLDQNDPTP